MYQKVYKLPQLIRIMNISHNITKNIIQLQEESKKKNPEVYRECEEALTKIRQIDCILTEHNISSSEQDKKELVEPEQVTKFTDDEIIIYEKKRLTHQIRPFIKALAIKKKIPPYVYDTVNNLMSSMVLEAPLVLELTDSLIMQLNVNRDHAIKIFQSFFFVIQYECVRGDTIMNLFYSLINILDVNNMIVVTNAKAMSKQIIYVIFLRYRNAYAEYQKNEDNEEKYIEKKADCKTILNDICEFMRLKNDSKINIELSLDFIEIIFSVEEIFYVNEIKEIFLRLVNQIDQIESVQTNENLKEKHNKIILCVVKNKLFTEDSHLFIEKSADNLHIFDAETIKVIFENEQKREIFYVAAMKNLKDENVSFQRKFILICNIYKFLKILDNENSQNNEVRNAYMDVFDYTLEIFTTFFENIKSLENEEDNIIEILKYLITNSIENKARLYWFIEKMIELGGNCCIECFKICFIIKEHLINEWKIVFDYIQKENDMNCFNFMLMKLTEFKPQELFYFLAFVHSPEHMRLIFKQAIDNISKDIMCFVAVLFRIYYDTALLCSVIDEYNLYLTEHDYESELLTFIFINSAIKKYSIKDIFSKHTSFNLFKNYNNKIIPLKNTNTVSDVSNNLSESDIQKLLITIYDSIRVIGNNLDSSWIIIFDTLSITADIPIYSSYNFKILQLISEEFYSLLSDVCQLKIPALFLKISFHETENINILLQILNLISDNSKHMNKQALSFELWKENLMNILGIIQLNMIGWNDVFDTGIVILFNILEYHNVINKTEQVKVYELIYDYILTEVLIVLKDLFYTKIALNKEINYDEKTRFKDTFILGLHKVNCFLSKFCEKNQENRFINDYYKFVTSVICFKHDIEERGLEQWKDIIALECLEIYKIENQVAVEDYFTVLEKIPIIKINDEKKEADDDLLYYKTNIYTELLSIKIIQKHQNKFMEKIERFFIIQNSGIRDNIFSIFNTNIKSNNFIGFSTLWLKTDDQNILSRLLAILKECYKSDGYINTFQNVFESDGFNNKEFLLQNDSDKTQKMNQSTVISVYESRVGNKITFLTDKSFETDSIDLNIVKDLLKNLTVLLSYDVFWEEVICVIQLIALRIRSDFELVKYFMEFSKYIFNIDSNLNERYTDIITLYGATENKKKSKVSLIERKREKILIGFMDIYMNVVSNHFIIESDKDSKQVNDSFVQSAFSIIYDLSFITSGVYRENLSCLCLKSLFSHSRFTKDLLIKRIRKGLNDYVNEINIFRDVYSRVKKNEVYLILDCIIENPSLVKELKNEIVDALSSKDFTTIDKIKMCLKKGM